MLELMEKLARRLAGLRPWLLFLSGLAFAAVIAVLLGGAGDSRDLYLIPAFGFFLWSLFVYSFLSLFAIVPRRPAGPGQYLRKLRVVIQRAFMLVLGWLVILLSLALLYTTWYLALIWFGS